MTPLQMRFFRLGCWAAIATAALHMVGQLAGPTPTTEAERSLLNLMASTPLGLPGASSRTFLELTNGFSLSFAAFLAWLGGVGLIIGKRGREDATLMEALAWANLAGGVVLLTISVTYWFIIPTACLAVMTACFGVSAFFRPRAL